MAHKLSTGAVRRLFSHRIRLIIGALLSCAFQLGCTSSQVLRDKEYQYSVAQARGGSPRAALAEFPQKEQGGFITTVEKNWLGYWIGETSLPYLQRQVQTFEERKFISLSREAEYFFYQESEDGYVPSEHEVIVLHLLCAQIYLRQQKPEEAQIELRRAGFLLQGFFTEKQSHFDDPALRIWLGSLWAAAGSWQDAQVDFRRAYEMSGERSLQALLKMAQPPPELHLTFSGVGPDLEWSNSRPEPLFVENNNKPSGVSFSSHSWYERHLRRNNEIRDFLMKSNYMTQFISIKSKNASELALGHAITGSMKALAVTIGAVGVGAGLYIVSLSSSSGELAGYIVGAGFLAGSKIWRDSDEISEAHDRAVEKQEKQEFENLRTYRFVRFLPEWITLEWKNENPAEPGLSPAGSKVIFSHRQLN